jgi:mannose-6-phosphate isomerase
MGIDDEDGGQDDNHKPEMALAITPFRALCGFRPLNEVAAYLRSTPELAALIPRGVLTTFLDISSSSTPTGGKEKSALKALFGALMTTPEERVKSQLDLLVSRYRSTPPPDKDIVDLVLLLSSQYPHDIGILCAFLLNHIHLSPGSAIFLGAGEPHAYLSGDCIECMANSDNVIRAGLTPKLRDVESLVGCLTYEAGEGGRHAVSPREWARGQGRLYDPPVPEFAVLVGRVAEGKEERWGGVEGPSIVLVSEGRGEVVWDGDKGRMEIGKGDVFFIGAGTEVVLRGGEEEVVLYRAFVEV